MKAIYVLNTIIQSILEERKCERKGSQRNIETLISPIEAQKLKINENPKCNLEGDQITHL